jgi:hypothetical protein
MPRMSDDEVLRELGSKSLLNRARLAFYHASARIEQSELQRRPVGPIERRRMEFEAVREIAVILGVDL